MQHAGFPHEGLGNSVGACDGGKLEIKQAGEGEQVITLVLQGDAHRANACGFRRFQPGLPIEASRLFQLKPAWRSERSRPGLGGGLRAG